MEDNRNTNTSEDDGREEEEAYHDAAEFVGEVDNRYISEDVTLKEGKVELTEEQIKVNRN